MKLLLPLIAVAGMILSASAQSSLRPQTTPPPAKPGSIFDKKTDTKAATIEFKVLLIIKKYSDTYSPLFLPIKSQMADADIAAARRCFEVETPDMVQDITQGKVRFVPTEIGRAHV